MNKPLGETILFKKPRAKTEPSIQILTRANIYRAVKSAYDEYSECSNSEQIATHTSFKYLRFACGAIPWKESRAGVSNLKLLSLYCQEANGLTKPLTRRLIVRVIFEHRFQIGLAQFALRKQNQVTQF